MVDTAAGGTGGVASGEVGAAGVVLAAAVFGVTVSVTGCCALGGGAADGVSTRRA